jgi:hypothetical protein
MKQKVLIVAFTAQLCAAAALATPAVGVASFEDGTSTSPVEVWYSPGSVTNVAGGHEGARAVAATGNVRIKHIPTSEQTRVVYWMKASVQSYITGKVQYYNSSWQSLGEATLDLTADGSWRQQVIRLNKPAGTFYVFTNMWLPSGVTATIDDVTLAVDDPAGAVDGFETASTGTWTTWYPPASLQNTNVVSHAGLRSVAVSGNVKFGVAPIVTQARFWHRRASGSANMSWLIQYYNANWVLIGESNVGSITSDTTWRQATIPVNAPAGALYVLVGVWVNGTTGDAIVNVDDFATTPGVQPARRPFASSSPWNVLAEDTPYSFDHHPELDDVHWWVNLTEWSIPVVNSAPGDPLVAVSVSASHGRPATVVNVRIPAGVSGAAGDDGTLQVNETNGISHSFWKFDRTSTTTATAEAYGSTPLDADGFTDPATGLNAGIRAAWCSPMAGLLTGPEIAAGEIEHALAIALPNSMLARGWVAPALKEDGDAATAYFGSIPMGSRLVVPPTATMPSGLSALGQKIWRAARRYGFLVVDRAGSPTLYADPRSMTAAQIAALREHWCPANCDGMNDLDVIASQLHVAQY